MSDTNVSQYLEGELAEHQRSFKLGVVAMILVSILIVGYFQWLKGAVAEMIAPQNIATLMVSEVKRNLPTARDAMEQNLKKAAPEVITFIADSVMDEALPMVTQAARALFRDYSRELTNFGTLAASQVFEGIVTDHKVELAKSKETAEAGFYSPDKIAAGLNGLIEGELGRRMNDRPEESVGTKLDESLNALKNINRHLGELAHKKKTTREEDLGRKLITTWWTFLNQSEPQGDAAAQLLDSTTQTLKTEGVDPAVPGDGTADEKPPAPKFKKKPADAAAPARKAAPAGK